MAGNPRIQSAGFHIPGHLLRAHQQTIDLRIVNTRHIAPRTHRHLPPRASQQLNCRVLQTPLRYSQSQQSHSAPFPYTVCTSNVFSSTTLAEPSFSSSRKKQLRYPSWQTPGPIASTRINRESASQSTRISFTRNTCPLVSPFFHNLFRE